jgi:hypothetical protein
VDAPDRDLAAPVAEIAKILGIAVEQIDTHRAADTAVRIIGEMTADGTDRSEPVRTILTRIGDRWTPFLVRLLEPAPMCFSQLRKMVATILREDISKQILSGSLHALGCTWPRNGRRLPPPRQESADGNGYRPTTARAPPSGRARRETAAILYDFLPAFTRNTVCFGAIRPRICLE